MTSKSAFTLIVGDDEMLLSQAVSDITNGQEAEIHRVDATGLEVSTVTNLLSPDLFADTKIVVISNASNLTKGASARIGELAGYLDNSLQLIITAGTKANALIKAAPGWGAQVVRTAKISNTRDKVAFAREEAKKRGQRITDGAARKIIDAVGGDLRAIVGAITQLTTENDGILDENLVGQFYDGQPETTGFAVADAAVSGNPAEALSALRSALNSGTAAVLIANALISQTRDMTRVRGSKVGSASELAVTMGMPSWKAEKLLRKLHGWSDRGLADAFKAALETDQAVKGQAADVSYALEKAVLSIALAKRK